MKVTLLFLSLFFSITSFARDCGGLQRVSGIVEIDDTPAVNYFYLATPFNNNMIYVVEQKGNTCKFLDEFAPGEKKTWFKKLAKYVTKSFKNHSKSRYFEYYNSSRHIYQANHFASVGKVVLIGLVGLFETAILPFELIGNSAKAIASPFKTWRAKSKVRKVLKTLKGKQIYYRLAKKYRYALTTGIWDTNFNNK